MAENVPAISSLNGETQVLIAVSGSKSEGFFPGLTFHNHRERETFFVGGCRVTSFSTDCSLGTQSDAGIENALLCAERERTAGATDILYLYASKTVG